MTIKEIARKAGVSIGTVDRVLHDRGRVSESTRETILKIVNDTGYKVNVFASRLARSRKYRFAVLIPKMHQDSGYWQLVGDGVDKAVSELETFNIDVQFFFFDRFSERSYAMAYRKIRKMDFDGVFLAPVISTVAEKELTERPLNTTYVFFDSKLSQFNNLSYIGQNSFQGGVLGGKLMHILIGAEGGSVAVTRMLPEGYHINDRVAGFKHYFADIKAFDVHEFDVLHREDGLDTADVCDRIVAACPNLKGVFVTNAYTHYFAEYLKETCCKQAIKIVGFDLIEENRQCVEDGRIDFVISQNPEIQGYRGIYLLYRSVILKENCEKEYIVPLDIITRENVDYCHKLI